MLSKIKHFFKSKKGDVIETILVIPIFCVMLLFLGYQMDFHTARNSVEDANRVVSRLIMNANSMDTAVQLSNKYLSEREDKKSFETIEGSPGKYFVESNLTKLTTLDGKIYTSKDDISKNWKKGSIIEYQITRKTDYADLGIDEFCPINIQVGSDGTRHCFKLLTKNVVSQNAIKIGLPEISLNSLTFENVENISKQENYFNNKNLSTYSDEEAKVTRI